MKNLLNKINGSGWIIVIIAIIVQSIGLGWKLGGMEEKITATQIQVVENTTDIKELLKG